MNTSLSGEQRLETAFVPTILLSLQTYQLCSEILHAPLFFLSILGIITNIINIRVFIRQGVASDSTTVSLFALAVSDLLGCAFIFPQTLCYYLENYGYGQIRNCYALTTMTSTYPHVICVKITCWITVYISVERAVCVLLPLKVKTVIKTANTIRVVILIYVISVIFHIPYAANTIIIWLPDAARNGTLMAVNSQTPLGAIFFQLNNIISNSILTSVAMVIVAMTTFTMIQRLLASRKWRAMATTAAPAPKRLASRAKCFHGGSKTFETSTQKTNLKEISADPAPTVSKKNDSKKELEILKTMTALTSVYLVCQACSHIPSMVMSLVPGVSIDGYNRLLFTLIYSLRFVFEVLNSSIHFFFYVKMSSKYRKTFYLLCRRSL